MASLKNFNPDSKGFQQLAVGPEMRAALKEVAEKGKTIAEGLAQDFRITGEYADSFEVGEATTMFTGEYPGPRAAAILQNDAPYAVAVEYGYEGKSKAESQSAHRVLGRTAEMLGKS